VTPVSQPADFSFAEQGRVREEQKSAWHGPASLLLAAVIHIALLMQLGHLIKPDAAMPHRESLLEVEFVKTALAVEPTKEVAPEPEKPEPVAKPPQPVKKPEPVVVKKPVKQARKSARPVSPEPQTPTVAPQAEPTPVQQAAPTIMHQPTVRDLQTEQDRLNRLRKHYLTAIMAELEAHKHYPYSARRRHIEGDVDISFMIDPSGRVSDIKISGGASVLRASSMEALQASRPLPPLPKALTAPIRCHCMMQYRLER